MVVNSELAVPLGEVELRTSRSSGPGGQHANVTASRVEAVFDLAGSAALSEAQRERLRARYGERVTAGAPDARRQGPKPEAARERPRGNNAAGPGGRAGAPPPQRARAGRGGAPPAT